MGRLVARRRSCRRRHHAHDVRTLATTAWRDASRASASPEISHASYVDRRHRLLLSGYSIALRIRRAPAPLLIVNRWLDISTKPWPSVLANLSSPVLIEARKRHDRNDASSACLSAIGIGNEMTIIGIRTGAAAITSTARRYLIIKRTDEHQALRREGNQRTARADDG